MDKKSREKKAEQLHEQARELEGTDQVDKEIVLYKQALELDPNRAVTHYNLGLIYKYQNDWQQSFYHNQKAVELSPNAEASIWNLGIAATALQKWGSARAAWQKYGIAIEEGTGAIFQNFGLTPIRLNAHDDGEVVWAKRLCPARAQIVSVPFPSSGFGFADIVLNDGAPVGSRIYNEKEYPVFNCLGMFEESNYQTYEAEVYADDEECYQDLVQALDKENIEYEDWTSNVRLLCKQCSEGTAHEHHDQDLKNSEKEHWQPNRNFGFACKENGALKEILKAWAKNSNGQYQNLTLALE